MVSNYKHNRSNLSRGRPELTPIDKLSIRIEMVEGSVREVQGRQRRLEDAYQKFVPLVTCRIVKEIIVPGLVTGLMETLKSPSLMEIKPLEDQLSIKDILEYYKKGDG